MPFRPSFLKQRQTGRRPKACSFVVDKDSVYRTVVEELKCVVFKIGIEGRWLFLSRAWTDITGYSVAQSIGQFFTKFLYPEDRDRVMDLFRPLIERRKEDCRHEVRYLTRRGGFRWIECHARLALDEDGQPDGVIGTLTDITDRKLVELQNRNLVLAQECTADGIALLNELGEYTYLNQAHVKMFGYESATDLLGKTWREVYHPDEIARIEEKIFAALTANGSWTGSATAKRLDGSTFPEELSLTLLPNGGLVCICRDATEKVAAAKALRASEARWQVAIESIRDGIWDADLTTGAVHLSQGWEALLGLSDDQLTTTWAELSTLMHPDDVKDAPQTDDPHCVLKTGHYDAEHRMRAADGTYRWLLIRGKALFDDTGKPVRMLGTAADISDRRQVYQQLLANLAREKELSEMRSQFVSMASHELRTPLAALTLTLEFLASYSTRINASALEKGLTSANDSARRLSSIVDDLLLLDRVNQGQLNCAAVPVNLADQMAMLAADPYFTDTQRKRFTITCTPPGLQASLDPQLLRYMLLNLLSNACKYSPDDAPVTLRATQLSDTIEFQVEDSGIGICENDQSRIYSLFFRGSNVGSRPGTGLGLMVVKRCVEAQHGTITFSSTTGKGTCFTVTLPS
jgi:PAS domain S-box-containing protein